MDPIRLPNCAARARLPRTRGDGPVRSILLACRIPASPHTRGWTPAGEDLLQHHVGFPAHAGMDPGRERAFNAALGLPRTRGDGPLHVAWRRIDSGASPHTRGWTWYGQWPWSARQGFPAHAGMDRRCPSAGTSGRRLPRTRGDGPRSFSFNGVTPAASPHTRGWTHVHHGVRRVHHGFPAHAGMDPARRAPAPTPTRLPRTRGDGPFTCTADGGQGWASPDPGAGRPGAVPPRLPRTRGDGPIATNAQVRRTTASLGIPVKWNSVSGDLEHGFRRSGTLVGA